MTARPHDAIFKETFSDLDNARGQLRAVLPPEVSALLDWDTLRLEPGTFIDDRLSETLSDLLFSVRIAGREVRLYLLFEHQSRADPLMPYRALVYVVRIWDRWLSDHEDVKRLPPVIPVLLAQVEGRWTAPTELIDVIDFASDAEREAIGPWVPACRLLVDDLALVTDAVIDARPVPARAKLILAALREVRRKTDLEATVATWGGWLRAVTVATQSTFMRYIPLARPGLDLQRLAALLRTIDPRAEETAMTTARELIEQGMAQGEAKGELAGRQAVLHKLLRLRFGSVTPEAAERIARADVGTLDRWVERVLTATSVDDVLAG